MAKITKTIARRVLETVDAGLVKGVGNPVPGQMCVEAAVCYAMGLPHGDDPSCVSPALRSLKIALNDLYWPNRQARAKGLRRLAVAQLGSAGVIDDVEFTKRVVEMTIKTILPIALRAAVRKQTSKAHKKKLEQCAARCETEGTADATSDAYAAATFAAAADAAYAANAATYTAYAANAAADAADAADAATYAAYAADAAAGAANARIKILTLFADKVINILVDMKAPGVKWLPLCD